MNRNDIAACGLACKYCELNEINGLTHIWEMVAKAFGKTADEVKCKGCWQQDGCPIHDGCETLDCVKAKHLNHCGECDTFPCDRLLPAVDMAERLPHNIKLYNLCRINLIGAEKFLDEAQTIKQKYFSGKMIVGAGPKLSN